MDDLRRIQIAKAAGVGNQFIRYDRVPRLSGFPFFTNSTNLAESYLITGPVDTGKSWLMNCLAVESLRQGLSVKILNWSRFKRRLRSSYQPAADETETEIYNDYKYINLLCIDDVGIGAKDGTETPAAIDMLYDLIDQRYYDGLRICLTTNLSVGQLSNCYGARIARRIRHLCGEPIILTEVISKKAVNDGKQRSQRFNLDGCKLDK